MSPTNAYEPSIELLMTQYCKEEIGRESDAKLLHILSIYLDTAPSLPSESLKEQEHVVSESSTAGTTTSLDSSTKSPLSSSPLQPAPAPTTPSPFRLLSSRSKEVIAFVHVVSTRFNGAVHARLPLPSVTAMHGVRIEDMLELIKLLDPEEGDMEWWKVLDLLALFANDAKNAQAMSVSHLPSTCVQLLKLLTQIRKQQVKEYVRKEDVTEPPPVSVSVPAQDEAGSARGRGQKGGSMGDMDEGGMTRKVSSLLGRSTRSSSERRSASVLVSPTASPTAGGKSQVYFSSSVSLSKNSLLLPSGSSVSSSQKMKMSSVILTLTPAQSRKYDRYNMYTWENMYTHMCISLYVDVDR